ncbi:RING-H2 finger protein ATL79-like [Rhodamnia argentea]|uniref:RING-H2 finger protein ATL79-like n=1 Tax=Rhodamnia argentea TaxID=178133 RepID=A0A8B8QNR4_9MYRT|nr:RING-H2 finger protein ATL79-like [Rhodamnia argentea]
MPPSPLVAPSPQPSYSAAVPLQFAPFALYAMSLACAEVILILVVVGYACLRSRRERADPARFDRNIERPRRGVEAAALSVVVVAYRGDARELHSEDCAICLASFEEGEECWVIMTCNHGYHESCIKEWLSRDRHCPLCRGSVQAGRTASVTPAPTSS